MAKRDRMLNTAEDSIPAFDGDKDVSVPVRSFDDHMFGTANDWLTGDGGFPFTPKSTRPSL
ncbi:hypothetical protein [Candidatus Poriferisocius sp.]|uniref:hypothetical protein n=1 Tax=Candidatus Poriferisocius sp. TaxID=3101276 RepID=UPI003B01A430